MVTQILEKVQTLIWMVIQMLPQKSEVKEFQTASKEAIA